MSITDLYIDRALCKHLSLMTPTMDISWENFNYSPTNGKPYLESWLLPGPTVAITLGTSYWEEFSGFFQVTCVYPAGWGRSDAKTKAAAIRNYFRRGTACTYSNITVKVEEVSVVRGYFSEDGSWYRVPVSIKYECFASNQV